MVFMVVINGKITGTFTLFAIVDKLMNLLMQLDL